MAKTLEECKKLWNPETRYYPVPAPTLVPPPMTQVGPLAFVVDNDAPWTFPEQETIELKDLFISALSHILHGYSEQGYEFLELARQYHSEVRSTYNIYIPTSYWFDSSEPQSKPEEVTENNTAETPSPTGYLDSKINALTVRVKDLERREELARIALRNPFSPFRQA